MRASTGRHRVAAVLIVLLALGSVTACRDSTGSASADERDPTVVAPVTVPVDRSDPSSTTAPPTTAPPPTTTEPPQVELTLGIEAESARLIGKLIARKSQVQ